jgi:hypothetical protein
MPSGTYLVFLCVASCAILPFIFMKHHSFRHALNPKNEADISALQNNLD